MKTTNRMNRALAMLLALSMIFSTQGMSVLADELAQTSGGGTELAAETEPKAEELQQTEAPAQKETTPQQTEAPAEKETTPQQTEAPEKKETAPQQTEAPGEKETAPQQTEAPGEKETASQQETSEETKSEGDSSAEEQGTEPVTEDKSESAETETETDSELDTEQESETETADVLTILYRSADETMGTVKVAGAETEPAADEAANETADAAEPESELVDLTAEELTVAGATAEAGEGYRFVSWTDESGAVVSEEATFIPEITDDMRELESVTFTANFVSTSAGSMEAVSANGLIVKAEWDEGTFPEGVQMEVTPVEDQAVLDEAQALAEQHREETMSAEEAAAMITRKVVGVDISFYLEKEDGTREELEPADGREVRVTMELTDEAKAELKEEAGEISPEDSSLTIVHSPDDAQSEVIATTSAEVSTDAVQAEFASDAFSTYTMTIDAPQSWADLKNWLENGVKTGTVEGDGDPNTFTMLTDIEADDSGSYFSVKPEKDFTLNLNGYTLNLKGYYPVLEKTTLTVNGGGNSSTVSIEYHDQSGNKKQTFGCGSITGATTKAFEVKGGATFNLNNTVFNGNNYAIDCENADAASIIIKNCYFINNTKGLIFNKDIVTIENSFFDGNGTLDGIEGGALRFYDNSPSTITNCVFWGNKANNGGAIRYGGAGKLEVKNSVFSENSASHDGGALYCDGGVQLTVSDTTLEKNQAVTSDGGAMKLEGDTSSCTLSGNTVISENTAASAEGDGGGIFSWNLGELVIENDVKIEKNKAGHFGGGVCVSGDGTELTIREATFSENKAYGNNWGEGGGGLAVYGDNSKTTINGTIFKDNYTESSGGGAVINGEFTMTKGTFTGNIAKNHEGGGLTLHSGHATINAGTFKNNKTGYDESGSEYGSYGDWGGGGIFVSEGATLYLPNNTLITDNLAGGYGGGLAGCSTGRIFTFEGGAGGGGLAVYSNSAEGAHLSGSDSAKHADHTYAEKNEVFNRAGSDGYRDYFCAFSSVVSAMRYDHDNAQWFGTMDGMPVETVQGKLQVGDVTIEGNSLVSSYVMGLTAKNTSTPASNASVTVQGNKSFTHGGGILCNGFIIIGPPQSEKIAMGTTLSLYAKKVVADQDGEVIAPQYNSESKEIIVPVPSYTFGVQELESGDGDYDPKKSDLFVGHTDENGEIIFEKAFVYDMEKWNKIDKEGDGKRHTFWYVLYEKDTGDQSVETDTMKYKFSVTVVDKDESMTIGSKDLNVTRLEIQENTAVYYWDGEKYVLATANLGTGTDSYYFTPGNAQHTAEIYFATKWIQNNPFIVDQGAAFTNILKLGSLAVTKKVTGSNPVENASYTIRVTSADGSPLTEQFGKTITATASSEREGGTATPVALEDILAADDTTVIGKKFTIKADETVTLSNLPFGTYKVEEDVPAGVSYLSKVSGNGTAIIADEHSPSSVTVTNTYVADGKVELQTKKQLSGSALKANEFEFVLKDAAGKTLQTVKNDAEGEVAFTPLTYKKADMGKTYTYTVSEVNSDTKGISYDTTVYTVTVEIGATVESNGVLQITKTVKDATGKVVPDAAGMTFANTFAGSVTLAKLSANNKVPLAGAEFRLYKKDGTQYANQAYTTGTDGKLSVKGLPEGEYYFVETKAPAGYVLDSTKQYPFTIRLDAAQANVDVALDVTNTPEETKTETKLTVTKEIVYNNELWNAVDETFYVALFGDEALTNRLTDVKAIEFRNSNTSSAEFAKLDFGTYYVAETTADGTPINGFGGAIPSGEMFSVDFHDGNTATLTKEDGTKEIRFRNVFMELPPGFYREGSLTITKELLDVDGQAKESDETFYAGIFSDAEHTKLAENVSENIVALALNGGSSTSVEVKVSIPQGGSTTLYVTEVNAQGSPVEESASFAYEVTVDGETVTLDEKNSTAETVITNQEREEEESETEEETEVSTTAKSVKTGDDTPITLYVGLLLAAALLSLSMMLMRRRRRG